MTAPNDAPPSVLHAIQRRPDRIGRHVAPTSIADAYAMVKVATGERDDLPIGLIVNRAKSPREAHDLHAKFEEIVGRFLDRGIDRAGYVAEDQEVEHATRTQHPVIVGSPQSEAASSVRKLSAELVGWLDRTDRTQPGLFNRLASRLIEEEVV